MLLALALLWSRPAAADVLFEGYSKVLIEDVHVGFVVQRYEFDPKKQEFIAASLLKVNAGGGSITESLKARSSASMRPIAYNYTELNGDKARTIDATFNQKTDMMTAVITENGKKQTLNKKVPKGSFLASFLAFVMLQGKEGIKKGVKYAYPAIAEEDANVYNGEAFIEKEEVVGGINTFKVLNTFKGSQFVSFVTYKGEVIATRSPIQRISTELVGSAQEAAAGQSFPSSTITSIFGSIPKGAENPISRRAGQTPAAAPQNAAPVAQAQAGAPSVTPAAPQAPVQGSGVATPEKQKKLMATPPPTGESAKKEGVPAGQGIMIKGQPTGN